MTDNSTDNNLGVTGPLTYTCGIPEDLLEPIFPYTFQSSRAIDSAHRIPPRFGKSSDLVLAITGTEKEQNSYLRGVLASDIALFSLFIVWIGVLIHFYRQGPQKRGWLSGRRIPLPPKPTFSANDDEQAVAPKRNNDSVVVLGRDDCTFRHKEDSVDSHMYTIQQEETSEAESEEKKDEENEGKPSEEKHPLPRTKEGKVEQQLEEDFQPIITEDGWIGRGWLSGRRMPLPPKPTCSANDDEQAVAPRQNVGSAVVLEGDDCTFRHKEDFVDSHTCTIQQEETSDAESEEKKDEENEGKPSEEKHPLPRTEEGKVEQQLEEDFQPMITEDEWNQLYHQRQKQNRIFKSLVAFAALSIIIAAILVQVYG